MHTHRVANYTLKIIGSGPDKHHSGRMVGHTSLIEKCVRERRKRQLPTHLRTAVIKFASTVSHRHEDTATNKSQRWKWIHYCFWGRNVSRWFQSARLNDGPRYSWIPNRSHFVSVNYVAPQLPATHPVQFKRHPDSVSVPVSAGHRPTRKSDGSHPRIRSLAVLIISYTILMFLLNLFITNFKQSITDVTRFLSAIKGHFLLIVTYEPQLAQPGS